MAVGFMLLFISFNTCQNFATKVLKDDGFGNLGFFSLAILYLFFAIFSFFSAAIVRKIGSLRVAMSIGAFCYSFWILGFLAAAQSEDAGGVFSKNMVKGIIIVTAGINGGGAGILWVA